MDFLLKTLGQKDKPQAKPRKESDDPWALEDKGFEIDVQNAWKYNLKDLCGHVQNYDKYCNILKKKYSELREEYTKVKEQDEIAQKELKDLKRLTEDSEKMNSVLDELNEQITALTDERNSLNKSNEELKSRLQSALSAKPAVQVESTGPTIVLEKSTTAKFDELNQAVSSLLQMIETASQEAKQQDFKEQLTNLVSEIDNSLKVMNSNLKELRDELRNGLQEKSQEISKSYKEDVENMKEGISIWQEKVSAMETINVALREGAIKNTATINSLQVMIDKLSKANEDLEKEAIALRNQVKHSKKVAENAKSQYDENLKVMREEKEEACKKQLAELENRIIQERLRYEGKSKEYVKLEDNIKEVRSQLHSQCEETKSALRKLEALNTEAKSLKEQLRDQKMKNKTLIDENHDFKTKMETRLRDRETQLDEITKKLNEALLAAHAEKPQSNQLSQENELNSVKLELTELKEAMDKMRQEHEFLTEKLEEQKKMNQDQRRSIQVLQEKRENALQEIKKLTTQLENSKRRDSNGLESLISARHIMTHDNTPISRMNESMMGGLGFHQKHNDKPLPTLDDMLLMKMSMEVVYQEFIAKYMPQSGPDEKFIQLERKINECITKTQDCIDSYDV